MKAKERIIAAHEAQLLNYLRATEIEIGLLFNFGKNPEFKRKYFPNKNKQFARRADSQSQATYDHSEEKMIRSDLPDPLHPL